MSSATPYITNLRAAGVDDANPAKIAGHGVQTLVSVGGSHAARLRR